MSIRIVLKDGIKIEGSYKAGKGNRDKLWGLEHREVILNTFGCHEKEDKMRKIKIRTFGCIHVPHFKIFFKRINSIWMYLNVDCTYYSSQRKALLVLYFTLNSFELQR